VGKTAVIVLALTTLGSAPAYAVDLSGPNASPDVTSEVKLFAPDCLEQIKGHASKDYCAYYIIDSATDQAVSISSVPANDLALVASDGTTLKQAIIAAVFPVRSKTWTQGKVSALGLWQTTHTGTTYYDGERVWGKTTYKGYKGMHYCNVGGWGVGYTITTNYCTSVNGPSTSQVSYTYNFRVSMFANGFPVWYDDAVVKHLGPTGSEW
jgi:hypothetical protein